MPAKIKLNPVRLVIPKNGNGAMLAMEYIAQMQLPPNPPFTAIWVTDCGDNIELRYPTTKHGIKFIQKYINENL